MTNELRFTQNFLKSKALVEKIVQRASLQAGDTVLEVGPGKGIITQVLAQQVTESGHVVAVELDTTLFQALQAQFANLPQVELHQQDILSFPLSTLAREYRVFPTYRLISPRSCWSGYSILKPDLPAHI